MSTEEKIVEKDQPADQDVSNEEESTEVQETVEQSIADEQHDAAVEPSSDIDQMSVEELIDALTESKAEVQEMKDGYLRAKAEMENIRRRSQNEVISARKYAVEGFASELLNVKDSLDQASQVDLDESDQGAVEKMKEGLSLTLKQLDAAMTKFAVVEVEAAPGVKFDPEVHQAISMIPSEEFESSHIVDVMQKGFLLKDRLLRPAMVVVAS
ncbi:MAG: nucleotide exchange factor GrpE [Acidiferrobacterales bacterium]|nr:nucleotide exchange factor GrpE [Acidiferrobacterales bacterium]